MRLPRILIALFFVLISVSPVVATRSTAEEPQLAANVVRDDSLDRANRSGERTPLAEVPAVPVTAATTPPAAEAAPVSTTAAPTTTAPPRTTTTTRVAPKVVDIEQAPQQGGGKQEVVRIARAQVGKAYRSGATGPNAFDCSGLVHYVFNQAGISIPRLTSDGYLSQYSKISRAALQPGDLVVGRGHIGIYVGDGQMVHASTPRGGVKLAPMDAPGTPIGYARI